MTGTNTILEFRGIAKSYGATPVLQDVNLTVESGDFLVVYGPPAAGKTVLMRILMGLETPDAGTIHLRGQDATRVPAAQRNIGYVPQSFALYPHISVHDNIAYPLRLAGVSERDAEPIVQHAAEMLKISDLLKKRPDQLSGGQKQRVAIARALAGDPDLVIADEPVSALDVSVQAAIINLLIEIQASRDATLVFISHDLSVVRYLADRVAVMYLGKVVEFGSVEEVFNPPYHPYTEALLSAVPIPDPDLQQKRIILEGTLPSVTDIPKGCPFATRCPRKVGEICDTTPPPEHRTETGHRILCHIPLEELERYEPVISTAAAE